ncbi:Plasma membrane proteolipid 31 [Cyberlindnera fabianii]|uniref:Plasma membrane proteolipid 31 n=1 Tax=Cyberlindnera fabianii TaxID=36022 RepID=A0A1V2KZF5_CYBFA|nr:Plasma membrane proteolipid 31 [Cyberlindnera fabianii]
MTDYQQAHNIDPADVFLYILAFFFPPLPVALRQGFWTNQLLLNVLLTMLFGLPGTLHAIYIVYITSPITGHPERRVRIGGDDYESLIENHDQTSSVPYNAGSSSTTANTAAPPPYEESTVITSTDNKIQHNG